MSRDKKRMICGTDFSVHAAEAADVAALARAIGSFQSFPRFGRPRRDEAQQTSGVSRAVT